MKINNKLKFYQIKPKNLEVIDTSDKSSEDKKNSEL